MKMNNNSNTEFPKKNKNEEKIKQEFNSKMSDRLTHIGMFYFVYGNVLVFVLR